jgi:ParB-like chromosome segregation protein Spo0J
MNDYRNGVVETRYVKIDEIRIDDRISVDVKKAQELADSIVETGLINPVMINSDFHLIAGFHRLHAHKILGRDTIKANIVDLNEIDAEMVKIDENLIRREFTRLERSEMLHRRKELYELKHPTKKTVSDSQVEMIENPTLPTIDDYDIQPPIPSFYEDAAEKMGVVPRTIRRDVQIAQDIPEDVRDVIRHTSTANNKLELLRLSRHDVEEQRRIAQDLVSQDTERVEKAKERLAPLMSSASPEWYTPQAILECVVRVMGEIDLDPCSNSDGPPNVTATTHYTRKDDGLTREWYGRVYMNPPYGREIDDWAKKLVEEYKAGRVKQAIALVPSRTDTAWFRRFREYPRCFVHGRLSFSGHDSPAPFPSMIVALGCNPDQFAKGFTNIGDIYQWIPGNGSSQESLT